MEIDLSPSHILNTPLINKGTAFTQKERDELFLNGHLPYQVSTIDQQVQRRYQNFIQQTTQLAKFLFLSSLQNRNEILFYRLISGHITEMLPYIYTPTVGDVSLHYSSLYKEHRGLYVSYPHRDKMEEMIDSLGTVDIDVVVVTDGERILGLGDVGVGGMAIPVGKLSLYTVFGGIHPGKALPVFLDVGTNNKELLADEQYVGFRHERITGSEYDAFVDRFVKAIKKKFPNVLLQWEDFAKSHARPLLERYQDELLSFNDDIQGTASVVLSAVISATRLAKKTLKQQKIVVLGGGSAGLGICSKILDAMEDEGMDRKEAIKNFYIVDIDGLIHSKSQNLDSEQKKYAHDMSSLLSWDIKDHSKISLLDVIKNANASVLIGVSTQTGAFTEEIIKTMAANTERPVILPLSNPTVKSEARPEDVIKWTNGRAIVATGSPFPPVDYEGRLYPIAQCNNVCIFPGLGLGVISAKAKKVTKKMFVAAARTLSDHSPMLKDPSASLFPSFEKLREISKEIAIVVATIAQQEGVAEKTTREELIKRIDSNMWSPVYPIYTRKK
jgi:malate dehydrogenase (oxaloacetate-decarboxylating)